MKYHQGDVGSRTRSKQPSAAPTSSSPRVHDHRRHRVARDDPGDQRRGHAQRVPGRSRGRREAFRLRLLGRRLRLPPRQPGARHRGPRVPRRTSSTPRRRPRSSASCSPVSEARRSSTCTCCGRRSSSGPHAVVARASCPRLSRSWGAASSARSSAARPCRCPCSSPSLRMQFIHEDDVGQAFLQCIVAAGPPGAYNITGEGVLDRRRRRARARPRRAAGSGEAYERRRARALPLSELPFLPARGRVGRGGDAAVDHGRRQGQARARLATALYEPRGPTRHDRGSMMDAFDRGGARGDRGISRRRRVKRHTIDDDDRAHPRARRRTPLGALRIGAPARGLRAHAAHRAARPRGVRRAGRVERQLDRQGRRRGRDARTRCSPTRAAPASTPAGW